MLQSVLFDRRYYDLLTALCWIKTHNLRPIKNPESSPRFIHIRLADPHQFTRIRTKKITKHIELRIGFH